MGDGKVGDVIRLIDQTNAAAWIQNRTGGVVADLISASGEIVARNQSVFDLRSINAGRYYLRVYGAAGNYAIEVKAPPAGQTAGTTSLPDRDRIDGGDGDDFSHGNFDHDRVLGGSGSDTIVSEPNEIRDLNFDDIWSNAKATEQISQKASPVVNPVIANVPLAKAIALQLGMPVTTTPTASQSSIDPSPTLS